MKTCISILSKMVSVVTLAVILAAGILTVPRLFGITPYIVQSGSMEPVIHTGAVAYIDTKDTDCEVGDIITYRLTTEKGKEVLVTHRIIEKTAEGFLTQGDANDAPDLSGITAEQVVGTYKASIPMIGYVLGQLNEKAFIMLACWIFALNVITFTLTWMMEDDDEEKEEKPSEDTQMATKGTADQTETEAACVTAAETPTESGGTEGGEIS